MTPLSPSLVSRLYAASHASRWDVSADVFRAALEASVAHGLKTNASGAGDVERYLESLHLEDLALACACAEGREAAWDHFVREQRPALYRAANAIDPSGGRELADSLYADLFGLQVKQGERQSLFRYFHGRSLLTTWLRAVLSQRHVDRVRASRRTDPLPEDDAVGAVAARMPAPDPERGRFAAAMRHALVAAVAALEPRDRLRLACYYAQDMTLAAIGRMLGEHEATASRHLTRTRRAIRESAEQCLRRDHGMDVSAIDECFQSVLDDPGTLDLADLIGEEQGQRAKDRGQR